MDPREEKQQPQVPTKKTGKAEGSSLRALRTFKDDAARALGKSGGVIGIAAAEQKRRSKRHKLSSRERELQGLIEQEGARIRTLSSQIEDVRNQPDQVSPVKEELAPPKRKEYVPPPGVSQAPKIKPVPMPVPMPQPLTPQPKKVPAFNEIRNAKLKEAQNRLLEAEKELAQTKQTHSHIKPERLAPKTSRSWPKTLSIVVLSLVLISIAGGISWYVYQNRALLGSVTPEAPVPSLVSVNRSVEMVFRPEEILLEQLASSVSQISAAQGELVQFHTVRIDVEGGKSAISASEFIELLATRAPGRVSRSLADTYTFGIHQQEVSEAFLVLEPTFFENAFAGMLEWESGMQGDLSLLFGEIIVEPTEENSTASIFFVPQFVDRIIQNKDTRVLLDVNGNIALMYSFIDRNTLLITTNVETFLEILGRLSSGRVVR